MSRDQRNEQIPTKYIYFQIEKHRISLMQPDWMKPLPSWEAIPVLSSPVVPMTLDPSCTSVNLLIDFWPFSRSKHHQFSCSLRTDIWLPIVLWPLLGSVFCAVSLLWHTLHTVVCIASFILDSDWHDLCIYTGRSQRSELIIYQLRTSTFKITISILLKYIKQNGKILNWGCTIVTVRRIWNI